VADYKGMYHKLFNAITDSVKILNAAQAQTEKMYVDHEPDVRLLKPGDDGKDDDS